MEQFATEEQQVEAIKRFWKENGMAIAIGAVLGLGGLWGWRYYNQDQINTKEQASLAYQQAVDALAADASGYTTVVNFIKDAPNSGYAALAEFQLAKEAVERSDLPEAAKQLSSAAANTQSSTIRNIANIRLARVQVELEQLDQALATLALVTDEAFTSQVQEGKGDVYVRQQLFDKARAAYSAALEKNATNSVLKMKLDNLAVTANG
jgi:predicted negative regulator of RcsB-dependent stress response